jgi:glycerophosphoryl diester phosphodiesterase
VLLDPPYLNPLGVMSPNNPFLTGAATHRNSRGFEGMAISPDGRYLYPAFEGATNDDLATQPNHRWIFEFDTVSKAFTGNRWSYQTEAPTLDAPGERLIADMWSLDDNRMVVIERDLVAAHREVPHGVRRRPAPRRPRRQPQEDRRRRPDGHLRPASDLAARHPRRRHRHRQTFSVVCESIEAIYPLPDSQLLLGCDNNCPTPAATPPSRTTTSSSSSTSPAAQQLTTWTPTPPAQAGGPTPRCVARG